MALCSNAHFIELKGTFHQGIVFKRRLVLLSGQIRNQCDEKFVKIEKEKVETLVPVTNKIFKHLISLKSGENVVNLGYCNERSSITLKYEPFEPSEESYDVQPLYIIHKTSDGTFQSIDGEKNDIQHALLKINVSMLLAQCIISSKFNENNLGERAFKLRDCITFQSDTTTDEARGLNQFELYDVTAKEILKKETVKAMDHRKFVAFLGCTKFEGLKNGEEYSYANINSKLSGSASLGGGFLCLMGSGCFYTWPNKIEDVMAAFSNKTVVDIARVLDDSNYRKTWGGCFATSLGSLIHEICHTFDLAHTKTGLMGNDIDYTHRFFLPQSFTENLPNRLLNGCHVHNQSMSDEPKRNLTRIKKPGKFLLKYHEQKNNDMTFFEENCLLTLWNHRWFSHKHRTEDSIMIYDPATRAIKSSMSPIKLIELRELDNKNSMMIRFWKFEDEEFCFHMPQDVELKIVSLFAINSHGDILKTNFL